MHRSRISLLNTVKYLKYVHFLQGIVSPHDLAVSQNGETVYVVEVPLDRKNQKIHKYDVINNNPDQGLFWRLITAHQIIKKSFLLLA